MHGTRSPDISTGGICIGWSFENTICNLTTIFACNVARDRGEIDRSVGEIENRREATPGW